MSLIIPQMSANEILLLHTHVNEHDGEMMSKAPVAPTKEYIDRLLHVQRCFKKETEKLLIVHDEISRIGVTASSNNQQGVLLLSCGAAAIALEPSQRNTRCGFCSVAVDLSQGDLCSGCGILVNCDSCQQSMEWHTASGECTVFQALVQAVGKESLDSCLLLTMRLMFRK